MGIDDCIGKSEVFESIVGQHPYQGEYAGDIPKFKIPAQEVDNVYLRIKKMQRCYHNRQTSPTAKYYAERFADVEDAYLSRDLESFQKAVRGLMIDIDAE